MKRAAIVWLASRLRAWADRLAPEPASGQEHPAPLMLYVTPAMQPLGRYVPTTQGTIWCGRCQAYFAGTHICMWTGNVV